MTAKPRQPDAVDAAIAASAVKTVELTQTEVRLVSGRPAIVALPTDATDLELLSLIAQVLMIGDALRAKRPSSRLVAVDGGRLA